MRFPIRARLTITFAAAMALVLAAFGWFLYLRVASELLRTIDLNLRARGESILAAIDEGEPVPVGTGQTLIEHDEAFAQILDPGGRILDSTPILKEPLLSPAAMSSMAEEPRFFTRRVGAIDDDARLLAVQATRDGGRLVVVAGVILSDRAEALRRLVLQFALGGPAALALASAAGWVVAGAALRPVERIRREAAAISASEIRRRLEVPQTGDELARLAQTLNAMLDRLEEALEREHRFVDDASHELRTPLAILKTELELSLSRPRSLDEMREALRAAADETDRLVHLAEDLLVLARTRGGRLPLRLQEVSLTTLLDEAVAPFRSRAADRGVAIEVRSTEGTIHVDPARIRQAIENLLDNAIRHGAPAGAIMVSASREPDGMLTIRVEDRGSGFPTPVLDSAFEPFARGSSAGDLDGAGAGAGLGLTIVRAVADAHGGHAKAENVPDGGARVTVVVRS